MPGLRLQHLQGIRALAELCDGRLEVGSREVIFHPRKIVARKLSVKLETAASTTLLMLTLLSAALAASAPIRIELQGGGTDVAFAPTLDHYQSVFLWFLRFMGADLDLTVHRRGFYPKGGAQLTMQFKRAA